MRAADLEQIAALEANLFTSASWSMSALNQELSGPGRTYFVWVGPTPHTPQNQPAEAFSEEVQGYGGIWYDGVDAELMTIGVARSAQRAGIGRALLCELLDSARQQGARRMLLEVRVDNEPAQAMYKSFGFMPMGLRKHYYQPEDVDALTMSLNLERKQ